MSVAVRGCLGSLPGFETGLYECPVLIFADYTKIFLLKTDASKEGLGVVLSQKQADRQYHPITYGRRALTAHEKTIMLQNLNS